MAARCHGDSKGSPSVSGNCSRAAIACSLSISLTAVLRVVMGLILRKGGRDHRDPALTKAAPLKDASRIIVLRRPARGCHFEIAGRICTRREQGRGGQVATAESGRRVGERSVASGV